MVGALRTGSGWTAMLLVGGFAAGGLGLSVVDLRPAAAAAAMSHTAVASTTVNIRSGPSTNYAILGGLDRGQRISAIAKPANGWVKVRFNRASAYMSAKYVILSGRSLPSAPSRISTSGVKITTEQLNVRTGPGVKYRVVGSLSEGSHVTLTGKLGPGFAQLRYAGQLRWVSVAYLARSSAATPAPTSAAAGVTALAFAKRQLGKPYRFGATGPNAYDCSGLVLKAWAAAGVSLPRTSQQQFRVGTKINKSQLRLGDLVFFYGRSPDHVGIYAGHGQVIHAPRPHKVVQYIKISYMPYVGARRPG